MYGLSLTALFLIGFLWIAGVVLTEQGDAADLQRINSTAAHLAVYGSVVRAYGYAHPGTSGSVADAALAAPAWFHRTAGEGNTFTAGQGFVYVAAGDPVFAQDVARAAGGTTTGMKRAGSLLLPNGVISPTTLPASIPDGAVVIVL